jgi:hypothetical protein
MHCVAENRFHYAQCVRIGCLEILTASDEINKSMQLATEKYNLKLRSEVNL